MEWLLTHSTCLKDFPFSFCNYERIQRKISHNFLTFNQPFRWTLYKLLYKTVLLQNGRRHKWCSKHKMAKWYKFQWKWNRTRKKLKANKMKEQISNIKRCHMNPYLILLRPLNVCQIIFCTGFYSLNFFPYPSFFLYLEKSLVLRFFSIWWNGMW